MGTAPTQRQIPQAPDSMTPREAGGINPSVTFAHGMQDVPSPGCTLQSQDLVFPFSLEVCANPEPFRSTEKVSRPPGALTRGKEDAGLEHPPPLVSWDEVFLRASHLRTWGARALLPETACVSPY